jgi:cbb3-type cytochrome oxidase maturation protein
MRCASRAPFVMDILFLLIPLSVVLALVIAGAFWLAVGAGQFDDLDQPALAILADDDPAADRPLI